MEILPRMNGDMSVLIKTLDVEKEESSLSQMEKNGDGKNFATVGAAKRHNLGDKFS
jgi:hypothetical protein